MNTVTFEDFQNTQSPLKLSSPAELTFNEMEEVSGGFVIVLVAVVIMGVIIYVETRVPTTGGAW